MATSELLRHGREMGSRLSELLGCSMDRRRVGLNDFEFGEVPSTGMGAKDAEGDPEPQMFELGFRW